MVQLAQAFDARLVRPSDPDGLGGFPVGNHPVVIKKTEMKANSKEGTGHHAELTLMCYDGPAKGSTAPYRLNLYHTSSQEATRIAYEQLSALCHVTGVYSVQELDNLIDKPFIAVVEQQADTKYTQIRGVLDINGDKPGQPGVKGKVAVAAAPAPAAQTAPAWQPPAQTAAAPVQTAAAPPAAAAWGPQATAPAAPVIAAFPPAAAAAPAVANGAPAWATPGAPAAGATPPAWATK